MSKENVKTIQMGQQQNNGVLIGKIDGYEVEYSIQPKEIPKPGRKFDPSRGYGVGR